MSQGPSDDPIDAYWQRLLEDWESDEKHKGFVGLAASLDRLADAARRYREVRDDARLGARARQGIDRVLAVAMQALTPVERERPPRVNVMLPLAVLGVMLLVTTVAARATGITALASPVVLLGEVVIVALVPWRRFASTGSR